jgi:iron complex transport system substrate-binding protein
MWKKFFMIVLVIALGVSLIGCADEISDTAEETADATEEVIESEESEVEENEPYLVFTDSNGREIVFENEPQRIISTAPNVTESIFALGAEEKLVGRTDYCNYPEAASTIDSIGSLTEVNIEKITELDPDVVIAASFFDEDNITILEELGIKVAVVMSQENFEGAYENIRNIALLANKEEKAEEIIKEMQDKVDYVKSSVESEESKSVYYVIGHGEYGDYTATGDTFIGKMLEIAGGENVAKEATGWKFSLEKLVEADPKVVIAENDPSTMEGLKEANGYKDLTAIKNGNFYGVDKDMVSRMGPRLADGLLQIAKAIHPEAFAE